MEDEKYLTEQIITYLGNKRKLLDHIAFEVETIMTEIVTVETIIVEMAIVDIITAETIIVETIIVETIIVGIGINAVFLMDVLIQKSLKFIYLINHQNGHTVIG